MGASEVRSRVIVSMLYSKSATAGVTGARSASDIISDGISSNVASVGGWIDIILLAAHSRLAACSH